MSVVEPGQGPATLVGRVRSILLQPGRTWEEIDPEPATIGGLYRSYVLPLALIPAVCGLIGPLVFGYRGLFGFHFRPAFTWVVAAQVSGLVVTLVGVYVLALIIDLLAPSFQGQRNQVQAFKVAAYSGTAAWVAGVFQILPALGFLSILGLYSFYLLYKGLPRLMKTPQEKAVPYTAVVVIAAAVIGAVAMMILGPLTRIGQGPASMHANRGEVTMPGGARVDLGQLEAASKRAQAAAESIQSGQGGEATDPSRLKAYLPATIAGYGRTELTASSGGVGGVNGSQAVGTYTRGDGRFTLTVTDLGAAGALTAMAGAFNLESSSESEGRYEKVGEVDGRMTTEEYDTGARRGEYSVLVADRFLVQAEGEGVSIEELKAAVRSVGFSQLEQLAQGD